MVDAVSAPSRDATGAKARPARHGRFRVARSRLELTAQARSRLIAVGALATVAGLWLILHPYAGVAIDARIYIGRALADLAPATIGQDLMFRHDGQAGFSAYTPLARTAVAWLGPQTGAAVLAFGGVIAWFVAVIAFLTPVARGRLLWPALACLAVLPRAYGGSADNFFGEALAVPRPFAEAGVLAALALVVAGRRWAALAMLTLAGLCHPIMAVCGFGVVLVVAVIEDRRWLAAPVAIGVATLTGAALGLPVFARLFQTIDPAWLALLRDRGPYLFPSEWPLSAWTLSAVQVGTVIMAAGLFEGRLRRVLIASVVVAGAAVLTSFVFADLWPSLLVVQAQPWRALWLTAALGAAMLAPCAVRLWARGGAGRLVLATLAFGWLAPGEPAALAAVALGLILFRLDSRPARLAVSPRIAHAALAVVVVLAVGRLALMTPALWRLAAALPPSQADTALIGLFLRLGLLALLAAPVILCGGLIKFDPRERRVWVAPLAFGAVVLGFGLLAWNHDPQAGRRDAGPDAGLVRMMAARPGPVAWVDGDTQAWMLAGRANWGSEVQGASIVFSRAQAMAWQARMRTLVRLGLGRETLLRPWMSGGSFKLARPTAAGLSALCREPDGPAWIVTPVLEGEPTPVARDGFIWLSPRPAYMPDGPFQWRKVTRYALDRC